MFLAARRPGESQRGGVLDQVGWTNSKPWFKMNAHGLTQALARKEVVRSDREKNWEFSRADIQERERWKDYQRSYEACLTATSTEIAAGYVVPADDRENARLIISQVILDTPGELKMSQPKPDKRQRKELQSIRKLLEK